MLNVLGLLGLGIGLAFSLIGVIGSVRLPDVFMRLHAASKVSSIGILGLLLASALLLPATAPKAFALAVFVLFSAPIASHAIARAAYRDGCMLVGLVRNDLGVQGIEAEAEPTSADGVPSAPASRRPPVCTHTHWIREVSAHTQGCEECLKTGDTWVHLRLCLTCGHVGCCDSSKNKHARKHFRGSGHPIMQSAEEGEDWRWCFVDQETV